MYSILENTVKQSPKPEEAIAVFKLLNLEENIYVFQLAFDLCA